MTDSASRCPRMQEAFKALLAFVQKSTVNTVPEEGTSAALFGAARASTPHWVFVDLSYIRPPEPHRVPIRTALPHPFLDAAESICVVTPPPQRQYKDELIASGKQPDNVRKIIDVKKLDAKFSDPVAKRALSRNFDCFMVDHHIRNYPSVLQGEFCGNHTPILLKRNTPLPEAIEEGLRTAVLVRRGDQTASVCVGHKNMKPAELAANAHALLDDIVQWLEGGWEAIHSVRLSNSAKGCRRIGLPVYSHNFIESQPELSGAVAKKGKPAGSSKRGRIEGTTAAPESKKSPKSSPAAPPLKKKKKTVKKGLTI
jgi:ribosomal protein L1